MHATRPNNDNYLYVMRNIKGFGPSLCLTIIFPSSIPFLVPSMQRGSLFTSMNLNLRPFLRTRQKVLRPHRRSGNFLFLQPAVPR
jgi:hypothetical protein